MNSINYISLTAELVEMIDKYAYLGFPLEPSEVCKIAFDFTEENNIVGFSKDLGTAGAKLVFLLIEKMAKVECQRSHQLIPAACCCIYKAICYAVV